MMLKHLCLMVFLAGGIATSLIASEPAKECKCHCRPSCTCEDCACAAEDMAPDDTMAGPISVGYSWQLLPNARPPQYSLVYCDGVGCRQIGVYRTEDKAYLPIVSPGVFGPATTPPIPPPATPSVAPELPKTIATSIPLTGVDSDKLSESKRAYWIGNREVSRDEAFQALKTAALTDDSSKGYLTAVGDETFLKLFRAACSADIKTKFKCSGYRPDSPIIAQQKFPTTPGRVYVQTADGVKVRVIESFKDSADLLAQATASTILLPLPKGHTGIIVGLFGAALLIVFLRKPVPTVQV